MVWQPARRVILSSPQAFKKNCCRAKAPSHHLVDLLDGQAQLAGLEAGGEVGLQHRLEVNALVEVIAFDLWHILWKLATGLQDGLHGNRGGMVCHLFCRDKEWMDMNHGYESESAPQSM